MKSKVETTGILRYNIICVNDKIIEFVDLKGANLAELAKEIGVDINHNVKAKISMEVVLEQCLFLFFFLMIIFLLIYFFRQSPSFTCKTR
jgi:hypothetical protein